MRRAHSEELLSEVGVDSELSRSRSPKRMMLNKRSSIACSSSGLLQVSDHPRMRHNSADQTEEEENEENNYENFAHELSHNGYLWNQNMNTRELTNDLNHHKIQVDLNSTNSDSNTLQSITSSTENNGILTVNSRPTTVSPERRLDMVLGSEMSQFSADTMSPQNLARPIPTFNSFGIVPEIQEIHRARPAYAPTPSPGESDDNLAPPLPARQNQSQPHSLPFFPYHQFPGRSVKPMRKFLKWHTLFKNHRKRLILKIVYFYFTVAPLDENDYSPAEDQSSESPNSQKAKFRSYEASCSGDFPSLLNLPLGSDGQGSHDSHNDSGYSTRFGYSAGPSPSLSGNSFFLKRLKLQNSFMAFFIHCRKSPGK